MLHILKSLFFKQVFMKLFLQNSKTQLVIWLCMVLPTVSLIKPNNCANILSSGGYSLVVAELVNSTRHTILNKCVVVANSKKSINLNEGKAARNVAVTNKYSTASTCLQNYISNYSLITMSKQMGIAIGNINNYWHTKIYI